MFRSQMQPVPSLLPAKHPSSVTMFHKPRVRLWMKCPKSSLWLPSCGSPGLSQPPKGVQSARGPGRGQRACSIQEL